MGRPRRHRSAGGVLLLAAFAAGRALAQGLTAAPGTEPLQSVTVTATRLPEPAFNVPASVIAVPIAPDNLGVNISESLHQIPGVIANNRQNYAQDEQISIRGFGARAAFGITDVRVFIDGIPESQPDGQGQVSQMNLASADRVEVLRGPFSALYGNDAGGVIQLFTASGSGSPRIGGSVAYGSFDTRRLSADTLGGIGAFDFNVGASQFWTDGARGHSAAQRTSLQGKFDWDFGADGRLTVLGNYFNGPHAQDPLGLTRAQFAADPDGTAPAAVEFNTRKSADQRQGGAIYRLRLSHSTQLRLLAYGGNRRVLQFLAIPLVAQRNPTSSGGVIDLDTDYGGLEPRLTYQTALLGGAFSVVVGMNWDAMTQLRRGYLNFVGTTLGVQGALRRDELDHEGDFDQYLQTHWDFAPHWSLLAGVRHSALEFSSSDHYIPPGTPNNSGAVGYSSTSPVAGLLFKAAPELNLYASYGTGFATPTFSELAYRPGGAPGLNFGLLAAHTRSYELGAKWRSAGDTRAQLDVFRADTTNELVIVADIAGRSSYANASATRRQGLELSLDTPLSRRLRMQLAYTYLEATFRQGYLTCTASFCPVPNARVAAGNRLPAVPRDNLYARLRWAVDPAWDVTLFGRYVGDVAVNDLNSEFANPYALLDLSSDYRWGLRAGTLRGFVRLDNLLDRRYAGSVIVDASNGQYYEGGPPLSFLLGLSFTPR